MCLFLPGPFPGAGLALAEVVCSAGLGVALSEPCRVVVESLEALEDDAFWSFLPLSFSDSDELEEEDPLELESDGGSGVFAAFFRVFLSSSESDSEEESESEDEDEEEEEEEEEEDDEEEEEEEELEELSEDSDSEEESEDDSDEDELASFFPDSLVFLFLGASSDSESDSEEELLDSALRFRLFGFAGDLAAGSSSSSSSASLSELEEEDDEEEDEEDEEEEEEEEDEDDEEELLDCFLDLGASFISTSESLDSSSLLLESLELSAELELPDWLVVFAPSAWPSQVLKTSTKDGAFLESPLIDLLACSFANAS